MRHSLQATDKCNDIWSFGCVLYEMLTGQIPFKGETISDTLVNILQTEPDWHALPESTPTSIVVLLRRCLVKDPRRRLRDIGDASIEIHETLDLPAIAPPVGVPAVRPSRRTLWKVAALCVFVGLVVGGIAMLVVMKGPIQPSEPRLVNRYSIPLDPENPLWLNPENGSIPVFTPDGRQLIYVAGTDWDRWLVARPLGSHQAQRIRGTKYEYALWPQVSPNGRWLAFAARDAILKVPLAGGKPERIADNLPFEVPLYVWEDNDTLILGSKNPGEGLYRFNWRTEDSESLTTLDDTPGHDSHYPIGLNRETGTLFFLALRGSGGVDNTILFAMSLKSRQPKRLIERAVDWYAPSGHLVYVQRGRLMAAPFDTKTLQITGPAVNVTEERMATDETLPTIAFSPKGTLVYAPVEGPQESNRVLVWVDPEGQEEPLGVRPMSYNRVHVSSDTARPQVAAEVFRDNLVSIYIYDTGGASPIRRLTFPSDGISACPIWMPDNREIVFASGLFSSSFAFRRKAADGSGEAEVLSVNMSGWRLLLPLARTPDGNVLVAIAHSSEETSTGWDIVAIHLERDGEVEPLLVSEDNEHSAALSPDGKWLAYVSDELLGRDEVFVTGFPGLEGKWHVSTETEGGREPVWAPDGKTIYYRDGASLVAVPVESEGGFSPGQAQRLFEDVYLSRSYDIHPDGKQFLMIKKVEEQEELPMTELIVVENWFEELKRLVPPGKNK